MTIGEFIDGVLDNASKHELVIDQIGFNRFFGGIEMECHPYGDDNVHVRRVVTGVELRHEFDTPERLLERIAWECSHRPAASSPAPVAP